MPICLHKMSTVLNVILMFIFSCVDHAVFVVSAITDLLLVGLVIVFTFSYGTNNFPLYSVMMSGAL